MHLAGFPGKQQRPSVQDTVKPNPTNGEIMTKHLLNKLPFVLSAFALLLGVAATAYGSVLPMEVTVFDARGKVAFQSGMSPNATFATGNLQPGNYVVQFKAKSSAVKENQYLLVVSAGKKKVIADAVPGEQFARGGVAMRISVGQGLKIEGQMASEKSVSVAGNPKVKTVNGHRYLWVQYSTGTNVGPHWEEEGLASAQNVSLLDPTFIRRIQDRDGEGSVLNRMGREHAAAEFKEYNH